jgi:hypothetical protein
MNQWPVLAHVNAVSLLDEGTEAVLDVLQGTAAATGVLLAVHGFNPEVMDRGRTWPGHGPKGGSGSLGGLFAESAPGAYEGNALGSPRVREAPYATFDALTQTNKVAGARGLDVYLYILESAGTGGYQRNVSGWPRVLEIDIAGRRGLLPCVNHPDYRAWKLALLEDLYKTHDFKGLLWGVERWGPLHTALAGVCPSCFCTHCATVASREGLDWRRVREGYAALWQMVQGGGGSFLKLLLQHPELLAWEWQWTRAYLSLHRELYGTAKWLAPDRTFGLGLWHYWFINPLLRVEWDMAEFAASADFIRPILYHVPEGPRVARYLSQLGTSAARGIETEALWKVMSQWLALDLPPLTGVEKTGLPASFVGQGVGLVRSGCGKAAQILAGIGIDVFESGLERAMTPDDVAAAIAEAHAAGADGITLARNYAEMRHENLSAAGDAVRHIRAG